MDQVVFGMRVTTEHSCMHPKHGPRLPVTWKPSNPFTWSVSKGSLESGGMILSVTIRSLYALISHLCMTRLPEVAMPHSDMWQDCQITFPHTRPCYAKLSYRSVDPQTLHGNVHQVDHIPNGPTNSTAITTVFPLWLCGGKPLVTVTRERCYGPSRLHVNDEVGCWTCKIFSWLLLLCVFNFWSPFSHSQPLQQQLLNSFSNVLIAFYGFSCQELVGTLSQICPDSGQLTAWLNGSLWDSNGSDWRDALNRTDMLMTLIKQYTEVCKCYCD